jgi:hypothetical protein
VCGPPAVSPRDAWAVGDNVSAAGDLIDTVILHWNGARWTPVPAHSRVLLSGVAAVSASDAWAVGRAILQWNGHTWRTTSHLPATAMLYAIAVAKSVHGWTAWAVGAAGSGGPLILTHCS